jgi:hypothetical protein
MNDQGGRARSLRDDITWLERSLHDGELVRKLRDVLDERPMLALGAAAGVGLVLGGLPRGALTVLLGVGTRVGTRMAGAWFQREFLESADAQERHS